MWELTDEYLDQHKAELEPLDKAIKDLAINQWIEKYVMASPFHKERPQDVTPCLGRDSAEMTSNGLAYSTGSLPQDVVYGLGRLLRQSGISYQTKDVKIRDQNSGNSEILIIVKGANKDLTVEQLSAFTHKLRDRVEKPTGFEPMMEAFELCTADKAPEAKLQILQEFIEAAVQNMGLSRHASAELQPKLKGSSKIARKR